MGPCPAMKRAAAKEREAIRGNAPTQTGRELTSYRFQVVGLVGGGHVPFSFFPKLEGDLVTASARLPYGAPVARTKMIQAELERSLDQAIAELGAEDDIRGIYTRVGEGPVMGGPGGGRAESGSHLVTVEVNLVGSTEREFSSKDFGAAWRAATTASMPCKRPSPPAA